MTHTTISIEAPGLPVLPGVDEQTGSRPDPRPPARRRRAPRTLRFLTRRPGLLLSLTLLALVLVAAFAPQLIAPGDPNVGATAQRLQPPGPGHWFGTDHLGRDLLTRMVHGTALSLRTALLAVTIALLVGGLAGMTAGFLGGWVDTAVMRVVDVLMAIPSLLLSLALIAALGFGSTNVAIAVAIGSVAGFARIARSQTLRVTQATYVEAARSLGTRWHTTLRRHVVPNASGPILALAVLEFGAAILAVSALSFLGYGAPRPAPEWGSPSLRPCWRSTGWPGPSTGNGAPSDELSDDHEPSSDRTGPPSGCPGPGARAAPELPHPERNGARVARGGPGAVPRRGGCPRR